MTLETMEWWTTLKDQLALIQIVVDEVFALRKDAILSEEQEERIDLMTTHTTQLSQWAAAVPDEPQILELIFWPALIAQFYQLTHSINWAARHIITEIEEITTLTQHERLLVLMSAWITQNIDALRNSVYNPFHRSVIRAEDIPFHSFATAILLSHCYGDGPFNQLPLSIPHDRHVSCDPQTTHVVIQDLINELRRGQGYRNTINITARADDAFAVISLTGPHLWMSSDLWDSIHPRFQLTMYRLHKRMGGDIVPVTQPQKKKGVPQGVEVRLPWAKPQQGET